MQSNNTANTINQGVKLANNVATSFGEGSGAVGLASDVAGVGINWDNMTNEQRALAAAKLAGQVVPGVGAATTAYKVGSNWGDSSNEQKAIGTAAVAEAGSQALGYTIPGLGEALMAYQAAKIGQQGYNEYYKQGTTGQRRAYVGGLAGVGGLMGTAAIPGAAIALGAISMVHGLTRSGKSQDQRIRDAVRTGLQQKGLADDDYNITLADGTKANIGIDGNGGKHAARDSSKLVTGPGGESSSEFKAYDTDYTNDLDYSSGMAGVTLNRLLFGGRNANVDKLGAQLGNAMLGKVGYGQDMTAENYNSVMSNARSIYARAGIKSKEDGLRLVALAAKQGRLTAADQTAAMQTLNMMYDQNGYDQASSLMKGRWVGINNLKDAPERAPTVEVNASGQSTGKPVMEVPNVASTKMKTFNNIISTKDEMRARNEARYAPQVMAA